MTKHPRRLLALVGIAALSVCFLGQAIAGAADDDYPPVVTTPTVPPGNPNNTPTTPTPTPVPGTLTTSGTVVAGGVVSVSGTGCGANQAVTIGFNGKAVTSTTTDPTGHFATSFPVPASTPPGNYTVTASNTVCVLSASVRVDPAAATRALAFTGSSSTIPILWVGVGLLGLGALLVFVARRRLSGARTF